MESGTHRAQSSVRGQRGRGKIRVAFHAHEAHLRARQHPGVGRPVRLMAGRTALQSHRRMLIGERPGQVAMALKHPGSLARAVWNERAVRPPWGLWQSTHDMSPSGSRCLKGRWKLAHTSLWQPAHCAFMSAVLRATSPSGPILMDRVALDTGHLVLGVAAIDASNMRALIQMAGQTDRIRRAGRILAGLRISAAEADSACMLPGP